MKNTELKELQDSVNEKLDELIKKMPNAVELVGEQTIRSIYFLGWADCVAKMVEIQDEVIDFGKSSTI